MRFLMILAAFAGLTLASPLQSRQQSCNNHPEFCTRRYSNVSFIGTHDSAFVGSIIDPRVNQEESLTSQLDAGIRFLQAQSYLNEAGTLDMRHTNCLLEDAGSVEGYLTTVKTWLDGNANAVLTMILVNGDNLPIGDWLTYGDLIANNSRLVMFLDAGANEKVVPYILDEFTYFFETPYDTTDLDFAECTLDRPASASPDGRMYIVNHFLDEALLRIDVPDNGADDQTNAATGTGSIGAQAGLCTITYGRVPNFILVDMFDRGDVFTAQNNLNGVSS